MERLEALCARSEHCEYELRTKLRAWMIGPDDAETIIRSLRKRRFVDDRRFSEAFVRDKYRFARWGRRKIEMALRVKRVDNDIITVALDGIDHTDYIEGLRHIVSHKAATMEDAATYEGRTRLFRFAVARGFEPEEVAKIIMEVL